jgi:hypothetical protein
MPLHIKIVGVFEGLTMQRLAPRLTTRRLRNALNQSGSPHPTVMRLFFVCGFSTSAKNPVMSGVGEYKTRKGNMSGPSLVGFLAPDTLTNALRKQPEVNGNAWISNLHDEGESLYP